jgi:site-specific DNA recombinase
MTDQHNPQSAARRVRCAILTRTSTEEGLDSEFNSLDAQRESGEAYAASQKQEGWIALSTRYDDAGYSGATLDRPAMQRLLADIEAGRVDVVIVYKIDRLSRSLLDFARLMEVFDRHGVAFVSVTQRFDTSTSMGRLMLNILLSFAQFEREIIGERIRDKVAATKRRGKYTGGPPVLGYDVDRDRKRLVVNPAEAALVLQIFADFVQTGSTTTLAQTLNAAGLTTKAWTTKKGVARPGTPWHKGLTYRVLNNRLYLGEVVHKGQHYPGEHEAIISQDLWDQAHAILDTNRRARGAQTRAQSPALLKGLLWCAHCGCAMTPNFTRRNGKVYRYYLCVRAERGARDSCPVRCLSAGEIERTVVDQLRAVLRSPEITARTYREARAQADGGATADTAFAERDVVEALSSLDPIWEHLFPNEHARIVQLLVEQVDVHQDHVEVRIRAEGLTSLVAELREEQGEVVA